MDATDFRLIKMFGFINLPYLLFVRRNLLNGLSIFTYNFCLNPDLIAGNPGCSSQQVFHGIHVPEPLFRFVAAPG